MWASLGFRIVFAFTAFAGILEATSDWLRLQSGNFEIYTSAGAKNAREALKRFDQIRQVFETRTARENLAPLPVRVFLFRNEAEFKPFQVTENAAGYYQSATERDYIAMQAGGADSYRVVYHEYAHLLMRHAGYAVPLWLNEGIAELYSTVSFSGSEVRIGDLIPAHIATLRDIRMLDLQLLLKVTQESPHYNERGKSGIFYAQSWALAHMLNFSRAYQPGMANFLSLVLGGEEPARAFVQAFGKTLANVQSDLARYVRQDRFLGIRLRAPRSDPSIETISEGVDPLQVELLLADLLLAIHRDEQAESILATLDKSRPEVLAARGDLALRRNDDAEARNYYENAIASGSTSGRVRYDLAMLLREAGEPEDRVVALLKEAVVCDPELFDAVHILGYLALQSQQYSQAIESLRRAVELEPARVSAWEHLALAYHHSGYREKALDAVKRARRLTLRPDEAARIDATIRLIERGPGSSV